MKLKAVGIALVALALAACSTRPTERSASAAAPAPAPKTDPVAAPTTATPVALVPNANGQAPVLNRALIAAGYKATPYKGAIYYCRTVDVTNTAFKRKVCLNEAQLREEERKTKEMQDRMLQQKWSPACEPFPACAG